MAQTVTELFDANATISNGVITLPASSFSDINNPTTATTTIIMAALLKHLLTLTAANDDATKAIENLKLLCLQVLQPIRDSFDRPIIVTSGYRCKTLTK